MSSHRGIKNRRSSSQFMPRFYLLLQIVIMGLVSYIAYMILSALGISPKLLLTLLSLLNLFTFYKLFLRCRSVSKRNAFTKKYQTN